jgi:hypothetical protein
VIRDIRPKTPYIEKPRNSILNQLNVEGLTYKNNINTTKGSKTKMTVKRIRIKIEIQNKFYF